MEFAALVTHTANKAYCERIGDDSQPSWFDAPDWQKDSARAGVRNLIVHPETTPEQSHESWMRQKIADGWAYGSVKDVEAKRHPCMVPYAELPPSQRKKDELFIRAFRLAGNIWQKSGNRKPMPGDSLDFLGEMIAMFDDVFYR